MANYSHVTSGGTVNTLAQNGGIRFDKDTLTLITERILADSPSVSQAEQGIDLLCQAIEGGLYRAEWIRVIYGHGRREAQFRVRARAPNDTSFLSINASVPAPAG